jgi:hypothetical protein
MKKKPEAQNLVLLFLSGPNRLSPAPEIIFSNLFLSQSSKKKMESVPRGRECMEERGGGATMRSVQVLGRAKCSSCGEIKKITFFRAWFWRVNFLTG